MEQTFTYYLDKSKLRKQLFFKQMDTITRNVMGETFIHNLVEFVKCTDNEDNKRIVLCHQRIKSFTGKSAFIATEVIAYISYDKKKKKMWTKNPNMIILMLQNHRKLVELLGIEAFITNGERWANGSITHLEVRMYSHKNIARAILKGLCTNRDNAVRRYHKATYGLNISLKSYLKMDEALKTSRNGIIHKILLNAKKADNAVRFVTQTLPQMSTKEFQIFEDLLVMALKMKLFVNLNWSMRRFEEEHDYLVREFVKIQAQGQPLVKVNYKVQPPEIKGITFFQSNRDLLLESKLMKHCIGTSSTYINRLTNFDSLLIGYDRKERGTADVSVKRIITKENLLIGLKFKIQQFYSYGNKNMSDASRKDLADTLRELCDSEFAQYLKKNDKVSVTEIKGVEQADHLQGEHPVLVDFDENLPF